MSISSTGPGPHIPPHGKKPDIEVKFANNSYIRALGELYRGHPEKTRKVLSEIAKDAFKSGGISIDVNRSLQAMKNYFAENPLLDTPKKPQKSKQQKKLESLDLAETSAAKVKTSTKKSSKEWQ